MIGSEVHDNKTTLATKGDLVEESVVNYSAEVCSNKRPRVEHFPAFSGEVVAANQYVQTSFPCFSPPPLSHTTHTFALDFLPSSFFSFARVSVTESRKS